MDARRTQIAIKEIKDYFERNLAERLNLIRVSAPLFVTPESGLNDNLSGKEKAVSFEMRKYGQEVEIVQSLAKWKRIALKWYGFKHNEGIYADMNAIRPDEVLDSTHSLYVDQWDWEKVIDETERTEEYLQNIVRTIFASFKDTEEYLEKLYPGKFIKKLPNEIKFISTEELLKLYPNIRPDEREELISKKYKAVFISQIGKTLSNGEVHDIRSPDYDDWELNGDIIFWNPTLNAPLELSSMGIRVNGESLIKQLEISGFEERKSLDYHKKLIEGNLPLTVGGGIGQSRMCMFFLDKKHIGEVQASVWTKDIEAKCQEKNVFLL